MHNCNNILWVIYSEQLWTQCKVVIIWQCENFIKKRRKLHDSDSPSTNTKTKDVYWMQNSKTMDYKYLFTYDTTYVIVPQKLQCSREYRNSYITPRIISYSWHTKSTKGTLYNCIMQHHMLKLALCNIPYQWQPIIVISSSDAIVLDIYCVYNTMHAHSKLVWLKFVILVATMNSWNVHKYFYELVKSSCIPIEHCSFWGDKYTCGIICKWIFVVHALHMGK